MLQALTVLLILAVLCEALVEWVKELLGLLSPRVVELVALAIGLVLAFGASQDLLALLGVQFSIPLVGILLAAFVVARGAGYIHDLVDRINAVMK